MPGPMPMPAPGAPPPGGGGTGPVTAGGPLAGSAAQGMAKVKLGLEALQAALPMIPMGSELHTDLMKAVSSITKHLGDKGGEGGGGQQIQQLLEMLRNAKMQGAPPQAGMMPGGPGGAPPPPGPGAPPPPPAM